ncbi:MAG TPA: efflux RND transporter periplasmic adaptor subunit, partial [Longimicrobiales bacterium]
MNLSRRVLSVLTVVILLGAVGWGIWWRLKPEASDTGEAQAAEADTLGIDVPEASGEFSTDMPQPVTGAEVVRDTLWISVRAAGRAEAIHRATLRSQVEGIIESLPIRENSSVAAATTLLQIDTIELALNVAQARSELLQARADFESRILFDDEITDPEVRRQREEFARAASGLNSAEVRLRQAELQLERSTVVAPFRGRIADLLVVEGQHISAGTDLMTVVDLNPIRVEAEVLEAELGLLEEGRRATVVFAAFPDQTFTGTIQSINPVVEERTGRVTVLLANPDGRVKPGMYADVSMEARSFPDRVLVPRAAVLERGDRRRKMVFLYDEQGGRGLAKWQYVMTG